MAVIRIEIEDLKTLIQPFPIEIDSNEYVLIYFFLTIELQLILSKRIALRIRNFFFLFRSFLQSNPIRYGKETETKLCFKMLSF